jgi:hydrogenase maturation protease
MSDQGVGGSSAVSGAIAEGRILVVGVGNAYRGDDAAGLMVARQVRDALGDVRLPGPRVEIRELGADGMELLEIWNGARAAVIVDAMNSGAPAGTVRRFDAAGAPLPSACFGVTSTHALDVPGAIELGRVLGRLPRSLVVIGIEGRRFGAGDTLSPELEAAVPIAARAVLEEVRTCTIGP